MDKLKLNNPNFKKNIFGIIRAIAFILIVVMIYVWLSDIFVPFRKEHEDGLCNQISTAYKGEDKNSIDVFLVGNSDIYRAYSPIDAYNKTGITSVVSGCPKLTVLGAEDYIKDILKYQSPKLIVIDTDCFFDTKNPGFKKGSANSNIAAAQFKKAMNKGKKDNKKDNAKDSVTYSDGFIGKVQVGYYSLKDTVDTFDDAILTSINYYYPLFKFHTQWSKMSKEDMNTVSAYKYSNKGMAYSNKHKTYSGEYSYMGHPTDNPVDIDAKDLATFDNLYKLCKENNIELAFVTVPSAISWNYGKHYAMENIAKKYDINYVDYNTSHIDGFDWKLHSKDGGDHMNYAGAQLVTSQIAKMYTDVYKLSPTALNESQKASWDSDYKYFHEKILKKS